MANLAKCCVAVDDVLLEGGRTGILLVHRLGGSPAELTILSEGLAHDGFTVSAPVLFGHCGSRDLLGATTWKHWYDSVQQAHDELMRRCDTVIVGGMGVGAMLALHLAVQRPQQVHGLVLLSPTFWPNGWAMPWYARLLRLLGSKGLADLLSLNDRPPFGIKDDELRRAMLAEREHDGRPVEDIIGRGGGTMLEVKWLADTVVPELPSVSQPCLIFHPRHDDRSSLSASQLLQRKLNGIVDLVVLEDSYHLVTLDRQRTFVLERTLDFADALPRMKQRPQQPTPPASTPETAPAE